MEVAFTPPILYVCIEHVTFPGIQCERHKVTVEGSNLGKQFIRLHWPGVQSLPPTVINHIDDIQFSHNVIKIPLYLRYCSSKNP